MFKVLVFILRTAAGVAEIYIIKTSMRLQVRDISLEPWPARLAMGSVRIPWKLWRRRGPGDQSRGGAGDWTALTLKKIILVDLCEGTFS